MENDNNNHNNNNLSWAKEMLIKKVSHIICVCVSVQYTSCSANAKLGLATKKHHRCRPMDVAHNLNETARNVLECICPSGRRAWNTVTRQCELDCYETGVFNGFMR